MNDSYLAKVRSAGNTSLVTNIPKLIIEKLGLKVHDRVKIIIEKDE